MSERCIQLRHINDILAGIDEDCRKELLAAVERVKAYHAELKEKVASNRQAFALLDAAGFALHLPAYSRGASYTLHLGFFANTKAGNEQLRQARRRLRESLGCPCHTDSTTEADAGRKTVRFILRPRDFPHLKVTFDRKLPRKKKGHAPKCRYVRRSYVTLVCES